MRGKLDIVNLGLVDSLLRMQAVDVGRALERRPLNSTDLQVIASVQNALVAHMTADIIIAPVGVGWHIDHRIITQACLDMRAPKPPCLFYLDVPYWLRVGVKNVHERVSHIESMLSQPLVPYTLALPCVTRYEKTSLTHIYASQLREEDVLLAVGAPFSGEVLLGVPQGGFREKLGIEEIEWMALNL